MFIQIFWEIGLSVAFNITIYFIMYFRFWILGVLLTYLLLTVRGSRISQHYGVHLSSHIVPLLVITFVSNGLVD